MPRGYSNMHDSVDSFISLSEFMDEVKDVPSMKPNPKPKRGTLGRLRALSTRRLGRKRDGSPATENEDNSESDCSESLQSISSNLSNMSYEPGMIRTKKTSVNSLRKLDGLSGGSDHGTGPRSVVDPRERMKSQKSFRRVDAISAESRPSNKDLRAALARGQSKRIQRRGVRRHASSVEGMVKEVKDSKETTSSAPASRGISRHSSALTPGTPGRKPRPAISRYSSTTDVKKDGSSKKSMDELIADFDNIMKDESMRNMRCAGPPVSPMKRVADKALREFEMLMEEEQSKHATPYRTGWD